MAEQDILDTPLNSPNQEAQLADVSLQAAPAVVPTAPAAPAPIDYFQQAQNEDQGIVTPEGAAVIEKFELLAQKGQEKLEALRAKAPAKQAKLRSYDEIFAPEQLTDVQRSLILNGEDSALGMSLDQAAKMSGAGVRTFGSFVGSKSTEQWGQDIIDQQNEDIRLGGYRSEFGGSSLKSTFEEQGFGTAVGRLWEMMQENAATSGVALAGGLAAAATAPFSGTAAILVLGGTTLANTNMSVGEAALEMEEKGVEINDAKVIGTGILMSLLDFYGAGKIIPKNLLVRMTGDQIVDRLVKKGFIDAAKGVAKKILGKSAWESGTEIAQESLIIGAAASEGAEYTREEVIDRFIDVAFVAAGMGGITATAAGTVEYGQAVKTKVATAITEGLNPLKQRAELAAIQIEELDKQNNPTPEPVEGVPLEPTKPKVPDTPTVALIRFTAGSAYHQLSVEERTQENTQAYMDEYTAKVKEAEAYAEEQQKAGTPINPIESEFLTNSIEATVQIETEFNRLVSEDGVKEIDAFKTAVKLLSEKAKTRSQPEEATRKEFMETILGSMKLTNATNKNALTVTEVEDLKTEFGVKDGESVEIDAYIALRKSVESVSAQVLNGSSEATESKFKGLNWHVAQVTNAVTGGRTEEATSKLAFLEEWSKYQAFKTQKFKEIQEYNDVATREGAPAKLPAGVKLVKAQPTHPNQIDNFTIDFDDFGIDKTTETGKKTWFFNNEKSGDLVATMITDSEAIADVHAQLASLVDPTIEAPVVLPVSPVGQTTDTPSTYDPVSNQEIGNKVSADIVGAITRKSEYGTADAAGNITQETIDNVDDATFELEHLIKLGKDDKLTIQTLVNSIIFKTVDSTTLAQVKDALANGDIVGLLERVADNINTPAKSPTVDTTTEFADYEGMPQLDDESSASQPSDQEIAGATAEIDPLASSKGDKIQLAEGLKEDAANRESARDTSEDHLSKGDASKVFGLRKRITNLKRLATTAPKEKQASYKKAIAKAETDIKNVITPPVLLEEGLSHNTQKGLFEEASDVPAGMAVTNDSPDSKIRLDDYFENSGTGSTTNIEGAVTPAVTEDSLIGKSYLKTIRNFFKNYPKILHILKLDDSQTEVLNDIRKLLNGLRANMPKSLESLRDKDYVYAQNDFVINNKQDRKVLQFPMLLLAKGMKRISSTTANSTTGTMRSLFDANVLNIINMAGLNWVATRGEGTLFNTVDDIHKIASNEGTANKIDAATTKKLHTAGDLYGNIVQQLGAEIYRQLGLKVKEDSLSIFEDRMITSLGMAAVESLIASKVLVKTQIDTNKIYTRQIGESKTTFIRIATDKATVPGKMDTPTARVQKFLDLTTSKNSTAYASVVQKVTGTEPRAKFPKIGEGTHKIIKKGATFLKSSRPLSDKVRDDVNRMNRAKWRFKPDMLYLLQPENREEATEFFKKLQGYENAIEDRPIYLQMGDLGRNLGILTEIQGVFDFYDMYVAEGSNGPFHFSYNTGENGRHNVNESAFSYQGSKLVRHLIFADNYSKASKDGFSVDVTPGLGGNHFQMFQYAVVQALSKSVKIDHGKHDEIVTEFYRIANDMDTREAAQSVLTNGYGDTVTDFLQDNGMAAHGLDGLQALGSYLATKPILKQEDDTIENRDDTKSFTTDLAIETDAITSGFMLTLMNFGALGDKNITMLSTGGIFLADEKTGEFHSNIPQFRAKTGNDKDVYTMLIDPWLDAVKGVLTKKKQYAPIENLVNVDRNTAKPIIMQGSYMAQYSSLVNNFINGTSDGQLGKLYERLHKGNEAERTAILSDLIRIQTPNMEKNSPNVFKKRLEKLQGIKLNEELLPADIVKSYESVLRTVYGETLEGVLDEILGMRDTAHSVNKMVNMMSWYYRWQVKKAIDAVGGYAQLTPAKIAKIYEDPSLIALRPYLPTPDSVKREEGLEALDRTNVRDHTSGDNIVKVRFANVGDNTHVGAETTYSRSMEKRTANTASRSIVVTVQSIDDAIVRAVMRKYNAMSAFDAVYTSIGQSVNASREYNKNVAEIGGEFSIFEKTFNNFMDVMKLTQGKDTANLDGLIDFMSEDTNMFNEKDFSTKTFLEEFEGINPEAPGSREFLRTKVNQMITDMTTQNAEIAESRKSFFKRLRVVDHMGMPGTAYQIGQENVVPQADTTTSTSTSGTQETLTGVDEAPKKTPKTLVNGRTVFDTDSLVVAIAKRGGINRETAKEVGFQDSELTTKGSRYSVFPVTGGTSADGILQDLGAEFLSAYGIAADISLDDFVQLLKGSINDEAPIYTDEGNAAAETEIHEEGLREEKLLAEQELADSQQTLLGSISPDNVDLTQFIPAGSIRANNMETIFDTLSDNTTNSTSHIAHLKDVLNRIIAKVIVPADNLELHLNKDGRTSYGQQVENRVYVNVGQGLALNLVAPSAKESYVHELIHVITRAAATDPKANAILRKISATMRDVDTHLTTKYKGKPWRVFLNRDSKGNPVYSVNMKEEIAAAKAAYDYVFNNKEMAESDYVDSETGKKHRGTVRAGLLEFLSYGMTNEHLNAALADMTISKYQEINKQDTIFEKMLAILENIMAWAKGVLDSARKKTPVGDNAQLLEQMVNDLTHVTSKYQFHTQNIVRVITNANKKFVDVATKKALKPLATKIDRAAADAIIDRKYLKTMGLLALGYVNPESRAASRAKFDIIRRGLGVTKRNFAHELYREIAGNITLDQRIWERKLMESRQELDARRDKAIEGVAMSITDSYRESGGTLSKFESQSHTRVLIETNVTSLIKDWTNINLLDLAAIISDDKVRAKAIAVVRKKLSALGPIGDIYIGSAINLGNIMATGLATNSGARLNASLIVRADAFKSHKEFAYPKNPKALEDLVNALATLTAIGLNTVDARNAVSDVLKREHAVDPKTNAAVNTLNLIDEFNKESLLRNFDGNNTLQQAGYSKEVSNPKVSILVDTLDKEEEYKKLGYTLDPEHIPTDPDDTDSPAKMGMYVNRSGGHSTRQKFIMSVTNTNMQGHSILQRAGENGDATAYAATKTLVRHITAQNEKELLKYIGNPDYVSGKPNIMIPVVDALGRIVDYRYTMGKSKKARIFEQKTDVEMILSQMYGSIVDKEATPRINNDVIKELNRQWIDKRLHNEDEFVEVSLNAKTAELREIYMILPDSTKRFIKEHTGEDKIMVQLEFVDIVFGRKKIRLPGNDNMHAFYDAWTQTVATAKKNIVVKWPFTLTMNVLSNTMFGIIYGVPPEFMLEMQAEGAIKLNNYVQDSKKLRDIDIKISLAEKIGTSTVKLLAEKTEVQTHIDTSPIMPLIKAGVFQTIVEDIDVLKDPYAYATKISDFFSEIQGKGGAKGGATTAARQAYRYTYMSDDTAVFKALMKTTQFSDFAARYAKYKYMTVHEKIDESHAMETIMNDFVNYESPTNKYIQFANDYGLQMFTKYGFRILRVLVSLMQGKPLNAIGFLVLNDVLAAGLASPFDASAFDNYVSPMQTIAAATTPNGVKLLLDTAGNVIPGN